MSEMCWLRNNQKRQPEIGNGTNFLRIEKGAIAMNEIKYMIVLCGKCNHELDLSADGWSAVLCDVCRNEIRFDDLVLKNEEGVNIINPSSSKDLDKK